MKIKKVVIMFIVFSFLTFMNANITYSIESLSVAQYEGIDVSDWQGYIDYSQVKADGIEVVYIKASQGARFKDPYFDINYENAKKNNLKVGFYHFLTATNTEEAEAEANFFASVISGKEADCRLVLDYEIFQGVNATGINEIARTFLQTTKRLTNKDMMIYSDLYNSQTVFSKELAQDYPLWIADYTSREILQNERSNWQYWVGWQYTDRGRVSGINGDVDRNIYSKEIFLEDSTSIPQTDNQTEPNTQTVYYTVKSGDTLGSIASIYGTTVEEIVTINGISNPNLIYPGQVLRILENSTVYGNENRGLGSIEYTVKSGDTLSEIAQAYGVSITSIAKTNNIENINLIYPGEKLRITESNSNNLNEMGDPNQDITYMVRSGDTLYGIANRFNVSVSYLVQKNGIKNPNLIFVGEIIRV